MQFRSLAHNVKALAKKGFYSTSLNDSTKVKLINKGSITFVSPFFANAMLCAVKFHKMRYEEKIIEHTEEETDFLPFKEAVVNIEFSQGDLIEMRDILRQFKPNLWAKGLLSDIETTLEKVSVY